MLKNHLKFNLVLILPTVFNPLISMHSYSKGAQHIYFMFIVYY